MTVTSYSGGYGDTQEKKRGTDMIILTFCSPDLSWTLFWGEGGSRSWLRNSPSCSSAMSVLTFRDKHPGFISGKLTSPDRSRLRATSARQIS